MGYKVNAEACEQIMALDWLRYYYSDIASIAIHIANERKTSHFFGSILKKMGVKKGVSDLFFPRANNKYHGLFIEVKTLAGRPTVEQKSFIDQVNEDGYLGLFCFGHKHIIDSVCDYFSLNNHL